MKKIISLTLIFLLMLSGCTTPAEPKVIPHTVDLPEQRPEDFTFFMDWGYGDGNYLDTERKMIGKDMVSDEDVESEIEISDDLLDQIYLALRHYDIASIDFELNSENCMGKGEHGYDVTPCASYLIRFRVEGKEYEVRADDTAEGYQCTQNFFGFVKYACELVYATPEYKAFPAAEGGYD